MFKIIKGFDEINWVKEMSIMPGRGCRRDQIRGDIVKDCDQRWYFFYDRIVNIWNDLEDKIIESDNVDIFKKHYDDMNKCK